MYRRMKILICLFTFAGLSYFFWYYYASDICAINSDTLPTPHLWNDSLFSVYVLNGRREYHFYDNLQQCLNTTINVISVNHPNPRTTKVLHYDYNCTTCSTCRESLTWRFLDALNINYSLIETNKRNGITLADVYLIFFNDILANDNKTYFVVFEDDVMITDCTQFRRELLLAIGKNLEFYSFYHQHDTCHNLYKWSTTSFFLNRIFMHYIIDNYDIAHRCYYPIDTFISGIQKFPKTTHRIVLHTKQTKVYSRRKSLV